MQYGDKLASLFSPIDKQRAASETAQVEPGSAYDTLLSGTYSQINDSASNDNPMTVAPVDQTTNVDALLAEQGREKTTTVTTESDPLVTGWNDAVSALPSASDEPEQQDDAQATTDGIATGSNERDQEKAFKHQEVISENSKEIAQSNSLSPNTQTTINRGELTSSEKVDWITDNDYAIQMLAMKNESVLNAFLSENDLLKRTRIYKTVRYGGDWFVVVDKQIYSSASQAQNGRTALPNYPGHQNAFVKSGRQIRSEINKVEN